MMLLRMPYTLSFVKSLAIVNENNSSRTDKRIFKIVMYLLGAVVVSGVVAAVVTFSVGVGVAVVVATVNGKR